MNIYYTNNHLVAPFLILPIAVINQEYSAIFMPRAADIDEMVKLLYSPLIENQLNGPIFLQTTAYLGKLLFAITIQTTVRDRDSGREGLKLTYGALIDFSVVQRCRNTLTDIQKAFARFFIEAFGVIPDMIGANEIVSRYQQEHNIEKNESLRESLGIFLQDFDKHFNKDNITKNTMIEFVSRGLMPWRFHRYHDIKSLNSPSQIEHALISMEQKLGSKDTSEVSRTREDKPQEAEKRDAISLTDSLLIYLTLQTLDGKLIISFMLLFVTISLYGLGSFNVLYRIFGPNFQSIFPQYAILTICAGAISIIQVLRYLNQIKLVEFLLPRHDSLLNIQKKLDFMRRLYLGFLATLIIGLIYFIIQIIRVVFMY
jgi:hypothetical protein